jgi:hypothetical protein
MKKFNENLNYTINAIESMTGNAKKDLKVIEFGNIFMILIMFYKPISKGIIDTGDGLLYEKIMSCLIRDDQIKLLKNVCPEEFSKTIKGEMGFIPSSVTTNIDDDDKITLKAIVSWRKWFGEGEEHQDTSTVFPITKDGWLNIKDVFE